ncbi:HET domain protein [Cordyceps fumosorosea ARSEF 2679]|uniref:HET domain protein n=1 Tax=Cordyceps fumosorosea (strain ARSEF 2679) TaxID=1081104 RepID=A0A168D5W7_CORFA|nr:HET domain protein [Cordyceps fumosorosea ARSEF 2679]OAA72207.1 HET domain protein [Cordyceps fumosorosea ARSEF 2679]
MKLVSAHTGTLVELPDVDLPPYAILSHTRDDQNLSLQANTANTANTVVDVVGLPAHPDTPPHPADPVSSPPPYTTTTTTTTTDLPLHIKDRPRASNSKATPPTFHSDRLEQACELARRSGVDYIWIAELCIDKTSTTDLDYAINGSGRRLQNATVCFVYLHDLPAEPASTMPMTHTPPGAVDPAVWGRCRYWNCSWTLQELIMPRRVLFYDAQWNYRGSKDSPELTPLLARITRIPRAVLLGSHPLPDVALAARIAWSAGREATREEDKVYALIALTGATLRVRYGEGVTRAFLRLQEELLRDTRDSSLLAWRSGRGGEARGLLARSPEEFGHFAPAGSEAPVERPWLFEGKLCFSSRGIELESRVRRGPGGVLLVSIGQKRHEVGNIANKRLALCLRECNGGVFVRVTPRVFRVPASSFSAWRSVAVVRDVDDGRAVSLCSTSNRIQCRVEPATHDDASRQGLPRVGQDSPMTQQQEEEEEVDVKMENDEAVLYLSPQPSHTPPSNHSDGSYVHVGPSKALQDDAHFSADSDPGSMTSNSASTSACASASATESDWGDDYFHSRRRLLLVDHHHHHHHHHHHNYLYRATTPSEHVDAMATEMRSTSAEDADNNKSAKDIVMKPEVREKVLEKTIEVVRDLLETTNLDYVAPRHDQLPPLSKNTGYETDELIGDWSLKKLVSTLYHEYEAEEQSDEHHMEEYYEA